jgi:glucokinase
LNTDDTLLVGDVGGTNVRFALAVRRESRVRIERFEVLPGDQFKTFEDALGHYLAQTGVQAEAACFAVAGPVSGGVGRLTNRNWTVSGAELAQSHALRKVLVVNDFRAMARSVPELDAGAFEGVYDGVPVETAPVLVAGPGTGFGVATLLRTQTGWDVLSGEGGHTAYAPRTDLEHELARKLHAAHGYVSNELVASGSGLPAVHAAFCDIFSRDAPLVAPAEMRRLADQGDAMYKAIIEVRALAVMGAAGDFALLTGALGGVVLAGGVTERLADFLKTPEARQRFVARGPMSHYLETCPVRLLHDPVAPLIGAAAVFESSLPDRVSN